MRIVHRVMLTLAAGLAAGTFTLAAPARADVPPPPGYVETCTVDRQQKDGEECVACSGAYHGDRDFCKREYEGKGYEHRCKTRGASVWTEVWCRSKPSGQQPAPAPAPHPEN